MNRMTVGIIFLFTVVNLVFTVSAHWQPVQMTEGMDEKKTNF